MSRPSFLPPAAAVLASVLHLCGQPAAAQTTPRHDPDAAARAALALAAAAQAKADAAPPAVKTAEPPPPAPRYEWRMALNNVGALNLWRDDAVIGTYWTDEGTYYAWDGSRWAKSPSSPPNPPGWPVVRGKAMAGPPIAAPTAAPAATSPVLVGDGGACAGGSCTTTAGQRSLPRSPWWRRGR